MGEGTRKRAQIGALLWAEKACLDCLITKNRPAVGLEGLVDLSTMCNVSTRRSFWKEVVYILLNSPWKLLESTSTSSQPSSLCSLQNAYCFFVYVTSRSCSHVDPSRDNSP
jgi:hypothetical protein